MYEFLYVFGVNRAIREREKCTAKCKTPRSRLIWVLHASRRLIVFSATANNANNAHLKGSHFRLCVTAIIIQTPTAVLELRRAER